jgi:hypothetical protein
VKHAWGEILRDAIPRVIDLVGRAIDGDLDAARRLEEILSPESLMKIQDLRAAEIRKRHFGDNDDGA